MTEQEPVIPRSYADYLRNLDLRVKEDEMNSSTTYSLLAELAFSKIGTVGEFHARLSAINQHEMGRASLVLCVLEHDSDETLVTLDVESINGILVPFASRRILHPQIGTLGVIEKGYLLTPEDDSKPLAIDEPSALDAHARPTWDGNPDDTRTKALETLGISPSYN